MSDLSSQEQADVSALSTDLDAIGAKLDAADANQLTQAEVDQLDAVKAKADALLSASPVTPTPVATGTTASDTTAAAPGTPTETVPAPTDGSTATDGTVSGS